MEQRPWVPQRPWALGAGFRYFGSSSWHASAASTSVGCSQSFGRIPGPKTE